MLASLDPRRQVEGPFKERCALRAVLLLSGLLLLLPARSALASDIWTVGTSGSDLAHIASAGSDSEGGAVFSPDGTKIAFDDGVDVYLLDADGSDLVQLTQSDGYRSFEPTFTASGTKITFIREGDEGRDLYRIDIDGSGLTHVLDLQPYDRQFAFSPDGSKIAFARPYNDLYRIYLMDADGSNPVRVTSDAGWGDESPAFSPDGSSIAFTRAFTPGLDRPGSG
jgi:Tol biopolymer transport system component